MAEYEYAKLNYAHEGSFTKPATMIWTAQIKWPDADRLEIRDEVRIEDVLNDLGRDGWEVVGSQAAPGINATEYILKRAKSG